MISTNLRCSQCQAVVILDRNFFRSVSELKLSVRAANLLKKANVETIAELCRKREHELLRIKSFGRKSLNEIKELLHDMGLSLGMNVKDILPPVGAGLVAAIKADCHRALGEIEGDLVRLQKIKALMEELAEARTGASG